MPAPANVQHLPSSQPAARHKPKSPNKVVAEQEAQWLFTEAELANTPSIQDGMTLSEEREMRAKGINFIVQVGIMLKLPQLTLSTAGVFFQRFLMRTSLKKVRNGIVKLHHFQSAAVALFLATKVEESCRKMKELITAFCRVAQKNPNLVVDEQSKDWWKWRDNILDHEDVMLEVLCFDLTVESPHRLLFGLLKYYGYEHHKALRNSAWAVVTDANNTPLCLMCTSRVICVAAFYVALRLRDLAIPDSAEGAPWWEAQRVRVKDLKRAVAFITSHYAREPSKAVKGATNGGSAAQQGQAGGEDGNALAGMTTPMDVVAREDGTDLTRMRSGPNTQSPFQPPVVGVAAASGRRVSNASSVGAGTKRGPDELATPAPHGVAPPTNGTGEPERKKAKVNGERKVEHNGEHAVTPDDPNGSNNMKHAEEVLKVEHGNEQAEANVQQKDGRVNSIAAPSAGTGIAAPGASTTNGKDKAQEDEGSEEGELGE